MFDHNDFIDFFTSVTPAQRFALHNDRRVEGVSLPTLLLQKSMIVKLANMVDMKMDFVNCRSANKKYVAHLKDGLVKRNSSASEARTHPVNSRTTYLNRCNTCDRNGITLEFANKMY